jgi:hypothetical protein
VPNPKKIPKELAERIKAVTNKRARFVLDHIAKHGAVSTIDLKNAGYDHPPRAVMDAKDLGFAIKRFSTKRPDGQRIASYAFDDAEFDPSKAGRMVLPKKKRDAIIADKGERCNLCGCETNLQVDHRIPFVVAGESQREEADPYQVLDGSCNRRKSWACQHCANWLQIKNLDTCRVCYWANPENYTHVAMRPERRIDLVWIGEEVNNFENMKAEAAKHGRSMSEEIKTVLRQAK